MDKGTSTAWDLSGYPEDDEDVPLAILRDRLLSSRQRRSPAPGASDKDARPSSPRASTSEVGAITRRPVARPSQHELGERQHRELSHAATSHNLRGDYRREIHRQKSRADLEGTSSRPAAPQISPPYHGEIERSFTRGPGQTTFDLIHERARGVFAGGSPAGASSFSPTGLPTAGVSSTAALTPTEAFEHVLGEGVSRAPAGPAHHTREPSLRTTRRPAGRYPRPELVGSSSGRAAADGARLPMLAESSRPERGETARHEVVVRTSREIIGLPEMGARRAPEHRQLQRMFSERDLHGITPVTPARAQAATQISAPLIFRPLQPPALPVEEPTERELALAAIIEKRAEMRNHTMGPWLVVFGCDWDMADGAEVGAELSREIAQFLESDGWLYWCNSGPHITESCHITCEPSSITAQASDAYSVLSKVRRVVSSIVLNPGTDEPRVSTILVEVQQDKKLTAVIVSSRELAPMSRHMLYSAVKDAADTFFEKPHGLHLVNLIKEVNRRGMHLTGAASTTTGPMQATIVQAKVFANIKVRSRKPPFTKEKRNIGNEQWTEKTDDPSAMARIGLSAPFKKGWSGLAEHSLARVEGTTSRNGLLIKRK